MARSRTSKVLTLSSGQFLVTAAGIVCAAVLARILSRVEYAAYRQTLLVYTFASPLLALGLPKALFYFLPQARNGERRILAGNLLLLAATGGILTMFLLCGGSSFLADRFDNPALKRLLIVFSPYPLIALPITTICACLAVMDRVRALAVFNVSSKLLVVTFVVGAAWLWRTPYAAVVGFVLAELLVLPVALWLMIRSTPAGSLWPSRQILVEQLRYSVPLGFAGLLGATSLSLDKWIVAEMCRPEDFAIYVNGAMDIPLISIITVSVTSVLLPDFVRAYAASEYNKLQSLWHRAMLKCLVLFLPAMAFVLVMAPEIMRLLYSSQYEASAYPFRVYALRLPVRATNFGAVLMAMGQTRMVTWGALFCLALNGLLSAVFVHYSGPAGAAWATMMSVISLALLYAVMIGRHLHLGVGGMLPWRQIARLSAATLGPTILLIAIMHVGPWTAWSDLVRILIAVAVFAPSILFSYDKLGGFECAGVEKLVKRFSLSAMVFGRTNPQCQNMNLDR